LFVGEGFVSIGSSFEQAEYVFYVENALLLITNISFIHTSNSSYGNKMNFFVVNGHGVLSLGSCTVNQTLVGSSANYNFCSFILINNNLSVLIMENCVCYNITAEENDEEDEIISVLNGQNVIMLSCTFCNISSKGNGGVLHSFANLTHIINCTFNSSHSFNPGCGGAIFAESTNLTIEFTTFYNCTAYRGGAVYSYEINCVYSFMSCLFESCKSSGEGGAVFGHFFRTDLLAFVNCIFDLSIFLYIHLYFVLFYFYLE
jgi:hypothetical protein